MGRNCEKGLFLNGVSRLFRLTLHSSYRAKTSEVEESASKTCEYVMLGKVRGLKTGGGRVQIYNAIQNASQRETIWKRLTVVGKHTCRVLLQQGSHETKIG